MPVFCVFCSLIMWAFLGWNIIAFSLCAHSFSICCTASTWLLSTRVRSGVEGENSCPCWGEARVIVTTGGQLHLLLPVPWASALLQPTQALEFEVLRRRGPPPSVPPQLPFGPSHAPPAPLSLLLAEFFLLCSWPMWPFIFSGVCPLKYIICILSNFAKSDRKSVAWLFLGVCEQTATHLR